MRVVSPAALRAMLAQETAEVLLAAITISHASFEAPYMLVCDQVPLTRAAGVFEPFAFDLQLPNEQDDQVPQVTLTIDNVDSKILKAIRTLPPGARPTVLLEVVLASSPDTVECGPYEFSILAVDYDVGQIRGTLGFEDDLLNTTIPAQTYTPSNSPGLFL